MSFQKDGTVTFQNNSSLTNNFQEVVFRGLIYKACVRTDLILDRTHKFTATLIFIKTVFDVEKYGAP